MTELGKCFETESLGHDQYQTTIGLKDINYLDDGIWKRNVLDWIDSGIGERPHIVSAAPFIASVSPDGLRRIHPTREDDVWFEMSGAKINNAGTWETVQLGAPTSRVDNRITWNRTNFNAYMDMAGHYVKLGYLLKNGYLPPNNQFAYEVATNGLTREGGTLLKDGVPVMHMRAPIAYDHDNPDDIRQIAHEIVRIDDKWHVVFTLPSLAGMAKPVIDPTLELQPDAAAGYDGGSRSTSPATTYETATTIRIGGITKFIYIKYDVSSISGNVVDNATSYLYNETVAGADEDNFLNSILVANDGWLEACNWNYANGLSASNRWEGDTGNDGGADAGCSVSGTDVNSSSLGTFTYNASDPAGTENACTLTVSQIQDWVDGNNYGMRFRGNSVNFDWRTSDHATAATRPKLVVNYTNAIAIDIAENNIGSWVRGVKIYS